MNKDEMLTRLTIVLETIDLSELMPDREVIAICSDWIDEYMSRWPEDHWVTINPDWDLNLFITNKEERAVLYPVVKRQTKTNDGAWLLYSYNPHTTDVYLYPGFIINLRGPGKVKNHVRC